MQAGWQVTVSRRDLIDAVGHARTRATLRRRSGTAFEEFITLVGDGSELSIRSSYAAMDIPAPGAWQSPILVNGAALRRLAPKLAGDAVQLTYVAGRLFLNGTSLPAREA